MPPELAQWIVPLIVIFGTLSPAVIIGVMLYLHRMTRQDMKQMESRLGSRMDRMETRLGQHTEQVRDDLKRLDGRVARLEHGQAKLEGLLEGLREAIARQPAA